MVAGSCRTPYQPAGVRGGYTDHDLGNDTYSIDINVNSYTSQGTAMEYAYRRAGELCENGFDVVDGRKTQRDFYVRTGNVVQNAPKSEVAMIVHCRTSLASTLERGDPPPRSAAPPPSKRSSALAPAPSPGDPDVVLRPERPACVVSESGQALCGFNLARCQKDQQDRGASPDACEERDAVACHRLQSVLTGKKRSWCSASMADCIAARTMNDTVDDKAGPCFVVRYSPP